MVVRHLAVKRPRPGHCGRALLIGALMLKLVETNQSGGAVTLSYRDESGGLRKLSFVPNYLTDGVRVSVEGADPVVRREAANVLLIEFPVRSDAKPARKA